MDVTLTDLQPGDVAWLTDMHRVSYARAEGFDQSFGDLVATILTDFERAHDPACERAFVARAGARRLGSVFCVRQNADTAKLRLFFLTPEARGLGLGKRMLGACMRFAKDSGYRSMTLWTHESHRAACALYARAGWQMTASKPVHNFGVDLIEQVWKVDLGAVQIAPDRL